jgi:hypothetical protein
MRFCPFCSAENADDLAVCQACGRRLPPLPPRRAGSRNAPPTGVQLPVRPAAAPPAAARRVGNTLPPPIPTASPIVTGIAPTDSSTVQPARTVAAPAPAPVATAAAAARPRTPSAIDSTWMDAEPVESTVVAAPPIMPDMTIPSAAPYTTPPSGMPVLQPPPAQARDSAPALPPPPDPAAEDKRRQLANALTPGPAAARREAPPDDRIVGDRRNRTDSKAPPVSPPSPNRSSNSSQPLPRPGPSQPPPMRAHTPSAPPPIPRAASQPPVPRAPSQPPPSPFGGDTFVTDNDTKAAPWEASQPSPAYVAMQAQQGGPPPTRIHRADELADRPFTPPEVLPVPEIPEPGLVKAAKYAYIFARARWQRRGAIKQLGVEIKQDTEALDQVLGALGRAARGARVEGRVFSAENSAIANAEERVNQLNKEHAEVEGRKAEENSKFGDIERERNAKLLEAERMVEEAGRELANLEAQRRSLRDRRKEFERRQRANLKAAEDHDRQSGSAPMGEQRQELRKVAEGHRREAAALEPERQEVDRQLGALDRPISEVTARLDAGKAELDAAKRSLNDAREGHTHRLAELDAEQKRKTREIGLAESEITRRLVTLGTLVNLNRIEDPQFGELYQRIDRLRSAITSRTTEIEKLTAEREAYDRGTLLRGIASIGGALLALIALIVILLAIL